VAAIALKAELTIVNIVFPVATVTGLPHFSPFQWLCVAGAALHHLMGTIKHEFRPRVMVKVPILPVSRIMAKMTVRTQI